MRRATAAAELNAPVGYDKHSYGYRSGGDKVHQGRRESYGAAFGEGDVVGMFLCAGPRLPADDKVRRSPRVQGMRKEFDWLLTSPFCFFKDRHV